MAACGVTTRHLADLIDAFKQDATRRRYADWYDLMGYCNRSAAPVGRFLLDLHGEDPTHWVASDALCNALQVLNHLQDCKDDYLALDRVYLPGDRMAAHGASVANLAEDHASPGMRRVLDDVLAGVEDAPCAHVAGPTRQPAPRHGIGGHRAPCRPARGVARRRRSARGPGRAPKIRLRVLRAARHLCRVGGMTKDPKTPYLLTPGPLTPSAATRNAMPHDWGSRDERFIALTARVRDQLNALAGGGEDHACVLMQGSGTFAVEAMLGTLVPKDGRCLILVNGAYGARMARICDVIGRDHEIYETAEDIPPDATRLDALLAEDETSTRSRISRPSAPRAAARSWAMP